MSKYGATDHSAAETTGVAVAASAISVAGATTAGYVAAASASSATGATTAVPTIATSTSAYPKVATAGYDAATSASSYAGVATAGHVTATEFAGIATDDAGVVTVTVTTVAATTISTACTESAGGTTKSADAVAATTISTACTESAGGTTRQQMQETSESSVATADQSQESVATDLSSTPGGLPSDFDAECGKLREGLQKEKSCESSSSDSDIEEIICDSCDNFLPVTDNFVCPSVDEIMGDQEQNQVAIPDSNLSVTAEPAQCLVADVLKEAAVDQPVVGSNDGFQDRRCNSSAEWSIMQQILCRISRSLIMPGFMTRDVLPIEEASGIKGRQYRMVFTLEKKHSARGQSKMLTPSAMRPSIIKAFEAKVVDSKSSNASAKINNNVIIQGAADQEEETAVARSKGDVKAGDDQVGSVADSSKLSMINEEVESISATSSSQVQNESGCQNSSTPAHNGQFQQDHKGRRDNFANYTWRQCSSRSFGTTSDFQRICPTYRRSKHAPHFNHYVPHFAWVPCYFIVPEGWHYVDVSAMPNAYFW
ncbi:OLC1v1004737C1 [Oldenlandia corymbosa var. corymbosa]|uniref:OLC1v1004737C1 n=1 Tax=Oldenlandia corymbosa var. corymbosa TaxID=529605 RepID=A0AAV1DDR6_OLDCO|nr:OLC1v1004737C1 [Oldenlandia corymbosa var. corymbosa]